MNAMDEAWNVLKANEAYQANLAGTNVAGTGGTIPQQFQQRPGMNPHMESGHPYNADKRKLMVRNTNRTLRPADVGFSQSPNIERRGTPERQLRPDVGQERSMQNAGHFGADANYMRDLTRREQRQQRRAQRRPQEPRSAFEPRPEFSQRVAQMNNQG